MRLDAAMQRPLLVHGFYRCGAQMLDTLELMADGPRVGGTRARRLRYFISRPIGLDTTPAPSGQVWCREGRGDTKALER